MKTRTFVSTLIPVLAVLIVTGSCATGRIPLITQPQGEYLHPRTKTVYPDVISGLKRMWVINFESEQPGLGVGMAYGENQNKAGRIKADVYIYDYSLKNIPDGTGTTLISQHFEQVIGDIYTQEDMGHYREVEKLSEEIIYLGDYPALSATFSFFHDNIEKVSCIYLTGYKDHFFKIRFTYYKSAETYGEETLSRFLNGIGKILADEKAYRLPTP
jgi:hypothetical protein